MSKFQPHTPKRLSASDDTQIQTYIHTYIHIHRLKTDETFLAFGSSPTSLVLRSKIGGFQLSSVDRTKQNILDLDLTGLFYDYTNFDLDFENTFLTSFIIKSFFLRGGWREWEGGGGICILFYLTLFAVNTKRALGFAHFALRARR